MGLSTSDVASSYLMVPVAVVSKHFSVLPRTNHVDGSMASIMAISTVIVYFLPS